MGFRGIERVKGVEHTTVIYWLKRENSAVRILGNFHTRRATPRIFPQNPSE